MKLYHFTSEFHLPGITQNGLIRGDVPTSPTGGFNAVWLTRNHKAANQGWDKGSGINKTGVLLQVDIDESDKNLIKWTDALKIYNVEPWWAEALNKTGGNGQDDWYIYTGLIPPDKIKKVKTKNPGS